MNLNQVTVGATDLDRSRAFYEALGLRLIVESDHYLRFECPEGGSTFSLDLVASVPGDEAVTIYFETDQLGEEWTRLVELGFEFEHPPTDMTWLWRETSLRDPDGHRICLFSAGVNRRNPPWRVPHQ